MGDNLLSVGLDVGTTTTQMVVSRLLVENRANGFSVPEMEISRREILYRGEVHFTPLVGDKLVDKDKIRLLVEQEYRNAGITREQVDTGAVIITGETSRKENAKTVLEALSHLAGDFVVATAGPDLESVLAARGAGAVEYSEKTGKTVLHMDIGGGTSNLCLVRNGEIIATGCLNVGGRLLKFDDRGACIYRSPALYFTEEKDPVRLAEMMVQALEMAAGLCPPGALLENFLTREAGGWTPPEEVPVLSFSGGVADCIAKEFPDLSFGDMGPVLGRAIKKSRLCGREYILGQETIRATVIGAGCHSTMLSGSTVFYKNVTFPIKNLPVAEISRPEDIPSVLQKAEGTAVLSLSGEGISRYGQVKKLAEQIAAGVSGPVFVALQADMAKALGHCLCLSLPPDRPICCIDRVKLSRDSFLDVGAPVGPALPVVVKTLILS